MIGLSRRTRDGGISIALLIQSLDGSFDSHLRVRSAHEIQPGLLCAN